MEGISIAVRKSLQAQRHASAISAAQRVVFFISTIDDLRVIWTAPDAPVQEVIGQRQETV